jgi:glucokinase
MEGMSDQAIGVDFGGTALKAALVENGTVLETCTAPTPRGDAPSATMERIAALVKELRPKPEAVGLAIPGEVDDDGVCIRLPNVPGFEGFGIVEDLEARVGCPVRAENDATVAALGELRHGHGREHESFLLLTLGTGIGGGWVLDGSLRRGAHGFAGEVGHLMIDPSPDAWRCGCGLTGCLEAYAGTAGLQRAWREAGGEGPREAGPERIAAAARAGDEAALAAFAGMGRALGLGIASLQNALDLDAIVLTGGISASVDLVEPALRETLESRSYADALARVPLLPSVLGASAGMVGAAELVR